MSVSPSTAAAIPSTKRPLDEEPSSTDPTDQPDAKRPALDKVASKEPEKADAAPSVEEGLATAQPAASIVDDLTAPVENGSEVKGEPDANKVSNGVDPVPMETHAIPSTGGQYDRASSQGPQQHQMHQDESGFLHMRAIISSAEAATVIGKGGENVSLIRRHSGAKCTVSDYSRGAVERVLTVSGLVDAVAKVRKPCAHLLTKLTSTGVWTHHTNTEQRAFGGPIHCPIQDISPAPSYSPHLDRLDYRKIGRPHSRNSGSIWSALECLGEHAAIVDGTLFGCVGSGRRCAYCQLLRGADFG